MTIAQQIHWGNVSIGQYALKKTLLLSSGLFYATFRIGTQSIHLCRSLMLINSRLTAFSANQSHAAQSQKHHCCWFGYGMNAQIGSADKIT